MKILKISSLLTAMMLIASCTNDMVEEKNEAQAQVSEKQTLTDKQMNDLMANPEYKVENLTTPDVANSQIKTVQNTAKTALFLKRADLKESDGFYLRNVTIGGKHPIAIAFGGENPMGATMPGLNLAYLMSEPPQNRAMVYSTEPVVTEVPLEPAIWVKVAKATSTNGLNVSDTETLKYTSTTGTELETSCSTSAGISASLTVGFGVMGFGSNMSGTISADMTKGSSNKITNTTSVEAAVNFTVPARRTVCCIVYVKVHKVKYNYKFQTLLAGYILAAFQDSVCAADGYCSRSQFPPASNLLKGVNTWQTGSINGTHYEFKSVTAFVK